MATADEKLDAVLKLSGEIDRRLIRMEDAQASALEKIVELRSSVYGNGKPGLAERQTFMEGLVDVLCRQAHDRPGPLAKVALGATEKIVAGAVLAIIGALLFLWAKSV